MAESEAALKWRGLIAEQAKGEKSVVEFCRERGVSREGFFRWRKRLNAKGEPRDAGFIEVRAAEEGAAKVLKISTPEGYRVEVTFFEESKAAEGMLLKVLGALR